MVIDHNDIKPDVGRSLQRFKRNNATIDSDHKMMPLIFKLEQCFCVWAVAFLHSVRNINGYVLTKTFKKPFKNGG